MIDLALEDIGYNFKRADYSIQFVAGEAYLMQKIKMALSIFKGEYWLDTSIGVPYMEAVFKKQVSGVEAEAELKKAITSVPGVVELVEFRLEVNTATRHAKVYWKVLADTGTILTGEGAI